MYTYIWKIISIDENLKVAVIEYFCPANNSTVQVGVRLPTEGQNIEEWAKEYAPISHWQEMERKVVIPKIGVSGVVDHKLAPDPLPDFSEPQVSSATDYSTPLSEEEAQKLIEDLRKQ